MLGILALFVFVSLRLIAFGWGLRRVVADRFVLGIAAVTVGAALTVLTLLPQTTSLVPWPAAYACVVVVIEVVPIVVAWRREHASAAGSEEEARTARLVRDLMPLALLDLARVVVVVAASWLLAD